MITPKIPLIPALGIGNPNKKKATKKNSLNNNSVKSKESGDIMNEKENNQKSNNSVTIENNVINFGNIDEEIIDDDKFSYNNKNNNGISDTNFRVRETNEIRIDTIKIENKANFKFDRKLSKKSMNKDIKSIDEKDELKNNKTILDKKNEKYLNSNNNINTNANI